MRFFSLLELGLKLSGTVRFMQCNENWQLGDSPTTALSQKEDADGKEQSSL